MSKKTSQEIIDIIKSLHDIRDFAYDEVDYEELGLGEVEEVDQTGGMDKGSNWSSTKYFKNHDIYIKVRGFYSSYDGTEFDSWISSVFEVYPKTTTKIIFEKI